MFFVEENARYSTDFTFYNLSNFEYFRAYYHEGSDGFEGLIYFTIANGEARHMTIRNRGEFDNFLNMAVEKLPFIKIVFTPDNAMFDEEQLMFINLEKIFMIQSFGNGGSGFNFWDNELTIAFESGKHVTYRIKTKKFKEEILKRIRNCCVKLDIVKKKNSRLEALGVG